MRLAIFGAKNDYGAIFKKQDSHCLLDRYNNRRVVADVWSMNTTINQGVDRRVKQVDKGRETRDYRDIEKETRKAHNNVNTTISHVMMSITLFYFVAYC